MAKQYEKVCWDGVRRSDYGKTNIQ